MGAAVEDVHHRHRQPVARNAAQKAVQWDLLRRCGSAGRSDGNRQNGVCTEVGFIFGAVRCNHVAQSEREVALVRESYGLTPVDFLKETGLLGKNLVGAHCIYTTDSDIKLLAKSGAHMAHCTEGLGRHSEFPPTKKMFDAGVHIVLGTDWLTMDPWTNMRMERPPSAKISPSFQLMLSPSLKVRVNTPAISR